MRSFLLFGICVALCTGRAAAAESLSHDPRTSGWGVGVLVGEPTGLSFKQWLERSMAVDAGVAWSFRRHGFFHLHMDALFHIREAEKGEDRVLVYLGPGARLAAGSGEVQLGLRIAGGIAFLPRDAPIDLFAELAPTLNLIPATEIILNGGIGIRYYFP
jgi:hypothetical protein